MANQEITYSHARAHLAELLDRVSGGIDMSQKRQIGLWIY
jgi:hypothetical protein